MTPLFDNHPTKTIGICMQHVYVLLSSFSLLFS
jgi:hypothetical protein